MDHRFNWRQYVCPEEGTDKHKNGTSCGFYTCKFCGYAFTYYSRNGPRTIIRHLKKHHESQVFDAQGDDDKQDVNNLQDISRITADLDSQHDEIGNIEFIKDTSSSMNANDLDQAIKAATKKWKDHFNHNDLKTDKIREERPGSRFLNQVFDCKYCMKQFTYCSRNGPGTLVKHLEKFHIPQILQKNPEIAKNSVYYKEIEKKYESFDDVEQHSKNKQTNDFANLFENHCLNNLEFLSNAAKNWHLHYVKNIEKTNEIMHSNNLTYDEDRNTKLNQEVYDCKYCSESKIYISRNGPKTLTKHLEKNHKKELLATNPSELRNSRKRSLVAFKDDDAAAAATAVAAAAAIASAGDAHDANSQSVDGPVTSDSHGDDNTNNSGKSMENELLTMAISESIKRHKSSQEQVMANNYSQERFHEDLMKIMTENRNFANFVKSSMFRNLIMNLKPEFVATLEETKSLYSSVYHLMSPDDSHKNNKSDEDIDGQIGFDNIAAMTSNIENSISQHNLLNT